MVNDKAAARLDRSFRALAHPVRRAIVRRLALGPATVGEATRGLSVSKPAITKHLRVLEDAGAIRREVQGRHHRLRLEPRPLAEAARWIERHRVLWEAKLDTVEAYLAETGPDTADGEEGG
jgi:DNA-binding transcriptional ArsR family regulator